VEVNFIVQRASIILADILGDIFDHFAYLNDY